MLPPSSEGAAGGWGLHNQENTIIDPCSPEQGRDGSEQGAVEEEGRKKH